MKRSIAVMGTLDTKGEEVQYLKEIIERRGHRAVVIDVGILGEPHFEPTISRHQVARAAGSQNGCEATTESRKQMPPTA